MSPLHMTNDHIYFTDEALKGLLKLIPDHFELKSFPGQQFRLDKASCVVQHGAPQLVLETLGTPYRNDNVWPTWLIFGRYTLTGLLSDMKP